MGEELLNIYFFAHQDDECGVLNEIIEDLKNVRPVFCIYLTTGVKKGKTSKKRNNESLIVLQSLGVKKENIFFVGDILSINDNELIMNLVKARNWILKWVENKKINNVFVTSWEGGHPDHDSLNAIVTQIFHQRNQINKIKQFPLYNGLNCKKPFFNVFKPIKENGVVYKNEITFINRLVIISKFFKYSSQIFSLIGLFFPMSFKILFYGKQLYQKVDIARFNNKPHDGQLYYEMRNFSDWIYIKNKINLFKLNIDK